MNAVTEDSGSFAYLICTLLTMMTGLVYMETCFGEFLNYIGGKIPQKIRLKSDNAIVKTVRFICQTVRFIFVSGLCFCISTGVLKTISDGDHIGKTECEKIEILQKNIIPDTFLDFFSGAVKYGFFIFIITMTAMCADEILSYIGRKMWQKIRVPVESPMVKIGKLVFETLCCIFVALICFSAWSKMYNSLVA